MRRCDISPQDKLGHYLLRSINKAIRDYGMITDGDRVAVGVSGGKDGLTLLRLLQLRQHSAVDKCSLVAVHIEVRGSDGTFCTDPRAPALLTAWLEGQGQAYAFETVDVGDQPDCFRCSYLRRKTIFVAAQRLGCNKVALGHHADDAAQTTLLNLVFHGTAETLSPRRQFFGGQLVLIRPMIYVPEKEIARFARIWGLPVQPASCPRSLTSRRLLVKNIIRALEHEYPRVKINLFRAGLRTDYRHEVPDPELSQAKPSSACL